MKKNTIIRIVLTSVLAIGITLYAVVESGFGHFSYPIEDAGEVTFSHFHHVIVKQTGCRQCHSDIFRMNRNNFENLNKEKESIMTLMSGGKFCGNCHNGSRSFSVEDECNRCHNRKVY